MFHLFSLPDLPGTVGQVGLDFLPNLLRNPVDGVWLTVIGDPMSKAFSACLNGICAPIWVMTLQVCWEYCYFSSNFRALSMAGKLFSPFLCRRLRLNWVSPNRNWMVLVRVDPPTVILRNAWRRFPYPMTRRACGPGTHQNDEAKGLKPFPLSLSSEFPSSLLNWYPQTRPFLSFCVLTLRIKVSFLFVWFFRTHTENYLTLIMLSFFCSKEFRNNDRSILC